MLIDDEPGNLIVVNDGGEPNRNINQNKKLEVFQTYRCPLWDKCCMLEYFFSNHVEYCR